MNEYKFKKIRAHIINRLVLPNIFFQLSASTISISTKYCFFKTKIRTKQNHSLVFRLKNKNKIINLACRLPEYPTAIDRYYAQSELCDDVLCMEIARFSLAVRCLVVSIASVFFNVIFCDQKIKIQKK